MASPGSIAQLTIVINTTNINTVATDHRVIPWEPTVSRGALVGAIVNDHEELAYRYILLYCISVGSLIIFLDYINYKLTYVFLKGCQKRFLHSAWKNIDCRCGEEGHR